MNITTVIVGLIVSGFGVYNFYASIKNPKKQIKLQTIRGMFGRGVGMTIYTIAYSFIPVIFGCFVVKAGFDGDSLMQFIES